MADNRAIGVFDSGLGGLTVLKELITLLPNGSNCYQSFHSVREIIFWALFVFLCFLPVRSTRCRNGRGYPFSLQLNQSHHKWLQRHSLNARQCILMGAFFI